MLTTAEAVAKAGAKVLRGGAFKPRTSPYEFQGLGLKGLKLLAKARKETGLAVITELLSEDHAEMVAEYADVLQIGTRNAQNFQLLIAAAKTGRPVLLKRNDSYVPVSNHTQQAFTRRDLVKANRHRIHPEEMANVWKLAATSPSAPNVATTLEGSTGPRRTFAASQSRLSMSC